MAIEEDDAGGIPEWVVTFGDMMSLLLTFFIMLVSMSEIKKDEQYQAMLASMRKQFGHDSSVFSAAPGHTTNNSAMQTITTMGASQRRNTEQGGSNVDSIRGEELKVQTIRPGKNSTLGGVVYFEEDSTRLSEHSERDLLRIIPQITGKPQKIEIRGHTSRKTAPKTGIIRDHWDLAYARCYNTMQFLIEQGIDPQRFRLGAAGATEPIDTGESAEHRKRNARVEVLMWDERATEQ